MLLAAAGVLAVLHLTRVRERIAAPPKQYTLSPGEGQPLTHSAYDRLLRKYVDGDGLVAYARWKAEAGDVNALRDYLTMLGSVDLEQPAPRAARLAFWINAYNALTLYGILQKYPTSSIREHTPLAGGYNIWKDLLLEVDGQNYSLNDIEHKVLRAMGEPRIHFAIVCASRSCPPLRDRAYTAEGLEEQLADNARRFFARPANFQADEAGRTVSLSRILQWFAADFGPNQAEQLAFVRPYLPSPERWTWLGEEDVTVLYLDYDWALNDQGPAGK